MDCAATASLNKRSPTSRYQQVFQFSHIIVATGSRPWIPPIPGLREVDPLTSASAFELDRLPESIIVLGGRYIALECAQTFARLGARVTVLQRSDHLLPDEDEDITEALAGYLREEGIEIETSVVVERVSRENGVAVVHARVAGAVRRFQAERVLCATGRRPITEDMGLEAVGIRLGEDGRDDHRDSELRARRAARECRKRFIAEFGDTKCSALLKKYKGQVGFAKCREMTARSAGILMEVLHEFMDDQ